MKTSDIITKAYNECKEKGLKRITDRSMERIIGRGMTTSERYQFIVLKEIEKEASKPPVTSVDIEVNWNKNPNWGWNPTAEARVIYEDGSFDTFTERASGCGYNKLNHVVNNLLNDFLKRPIYEYAIEHNLDIQFARWNEGGLECVSAKLAKIGYSFKHEDLKKCDLIVIKKS